MEGLVNDYFLHLVASCPKTKDELIQVCLSVVQSYNAAKQEAADMFTQAEGLPEICAATSSVLRCLRGLVGICQARPEITVSAEDVESVSRPKAKKALTVKSGVTTLSGGRNSDFSVVVRFGVVAG